MVGARVVLAALVLGAVPGLARAQGFGPAPTAEQCRGWAEALVEGGAAALHALTYGALARCPDEAPAAVEAAILGARTVSDTTYLDRLAGLAGDVRDPAVFSAALAVAADPRAGDRARVLGLVVTTAQLGGGQEVQGHSRAELFTQAMPADELCGFGVGFPAAIDNGLPVDAERQAAKVIDGIRYGRGEPALVQNLARCARTVIDPAVPPQVDVSRVRVDYVCGRRFRVQNHTGAHLVLSYVLEGAAGDTLEEAGVGVPSQGPWTPFTVVRPEGTLHVSHDGRPIATVAATAKPCGGR